MAFNSLIYYKGFLSLLTMTSQLINPDEQDLLLRLHNGDQHAFNFIFTKFYATLCLFSTRLIANRPAAEELVQDILYKLWCKHADFESLASIKAFLYISTRNASLNYLDKEQRKVKHDAAIALSADALEEPVINEIIYLEVLREISLEISQLPEQCGKIIQMIYEEGTKPQEIANRLHITVSTVYNQKMRGLSILKKRLSGRGFNVVVTMILSSYFS